VRVLGIAGYSGSGKTTLVERLIPALRRRGVRISTMKHTHHNVSLDRRGDVSRALRDAGAVEVAVLGPDVWAILRELHGAPEPGVEALAARMRPADLLIVEGFKQHAHDKIEVHRQATGKPLLCVDDPHIVAVASDTPLPGIAPPVLDLDDVEAITAFIVARYGFD